jgi:hypothetical protein
MTEFEPKSFMPLKNKLLKYWSAFLMSAAENHCRLNAPPAN